MLAPLAKIGAPLTRKNMPCVPVPSLLVLRTTVSVSVSLMVTSAKTRNPMRLVAVVGGDAGGAGAQRALIL